MILMALPENNRAIKSKELCKRAKSIWSALILYEGSLFPAYYGNVSPFLTLKS